LSGTRTHLLGRANAAHLRPRLYQLYDKVWREDILAHAYALARENRGAPGVDGVTFKQIETEGREEWLLRLREDLRQRTYRAQPVRRVMIPKPGGGERPLGIPTIRDRVVQTAAKLMIEPIFEADLDDSAYGYRPKRGATDAIKAVHRLVCRGYSDVVDADLSKYFDNIPHRELMLCVARRIVDRNVLALIKMWLKAPVEERDGDGGRRMSGGKSVNRRGTLTPRIASRRNVTGGSRGRSRIVRWRGCWRTGGVPGMGTGLEGEVLHGASW
jgi:RNA-directed DNA polymerase